MVLSLLDILSIISLVIFVLASLSFLFVAYLAIRNDSSYKVNQFFSLAFVFAFFYFIFMGLYILPVFSFLDQGQLFAFLGLIFINLSIATFAIVSDFIQYEGMQKQNAFMILVIGLIGIIATYFVVVFFADFQILMIAFIVLNLSLTINSLRFVIVLYRVSKKVSDDAFFKRKVNAYNIGFVLFNILSALGWTLAIFLPLGPELSPLPPGILTLLASLLMARSFLLKK